MRYLLSKKTSLWLLAGVAPLVAAAAAFAAGEDSTASGGAGAAERANTYLQASQKELRSAGIDVSSIELATTGDGMDYYALRGAKDHCILAAASGKRAGSSGGLACAPNDSAKPLGLPITDADSRAVGYAFWTEGGSLSATASDSGAPLQVSVTQPVSVVELAAPGQGFDVTWIPRSGERTTYSVKSAAEIQRELDAIVEQRDAAAPGAPATPGPAASG